MPIGLWRACELDVPVDLCRAWNSLDIVFCTASILSILLISFDRSLACFSPLSHLKYRSSNTATRFLITIWCSSVVVGIWNFFIHDEKSYEGTLDVAEIISELEIPDALAENVTSELQKHYEEKFQPVTNSNEAVMYTICALKMDPTFAIWSSTISFYLPILLILCCTCILYQAGSNALKRTGHVSSDQLRALQSTKNEMSTAYSPYSLYRTLYDRMNAAKSPLAKSSSDKKSPFPPSEATNPSSVNNGTLIPQAENTQTRNSSVKYNSSNSVNATRLLRTCLLVCISFLVCWFPFACINPLKSYYRNWFTEEVGRVLQEFSIWLGWINSAFNPVIYYYVLGSKRHSKSDTKNASMRRMILSPMTSISEN